MRDPCRIRRDWALFLDLDGTLLDIACRPDLVAVPDSLPHDLHRLRSALGGALAVVSGRALPVLDDLLAPFSAAGAGEHGAVVRMPDGRLKETAAPSIPESWLAALERASAEWLGTMVERKPRSVAMHFREAPSRGSEVSQLVHHLPGLAERGFIVLPARMAFEVKPKGASKARAVALLMEEQPFAGRHPVFVGDDVTDEAGIEMAQALGGHGLRVQDEFGGDPAAVRAWIARGIGESA